MNNKIILFLILIIAFLLRFINIQNNPTALYGDELTIVLDSYSLLKMGTDQLGNPFPLTFEMGAGRPAGYVYGSIPFVALFGPTALGVRMLSILSGVGIVFLLFLITKNFFSEKVGILSAALISVTPWAINISRGGFEANFALFLTLLGIYFLILSKAKPVFLILSALIFGLTIHTYPTYKLSLPLILPFIFWYLKPFGNFGNSRNNIFLGVSILVILLFTVLAISQTFLATSEVRFSQINIFSKGELKEQIEQKINLERNLSSLPIIISQYFHNKPIEYSKVFIENYLQNFSLDFLVIHGDGNPRHNMATMGGIFLSQFILFFIGLIAFWTKEKRVMIMLLSWLILAPIPTAIVDLPHNLRSSFMLPPLIIISTLGLLTITNQRNKLLLFLIGGAIIIQFIFFIQKLFFLSPNEYSRFWSYPAKIASEIALENQHKFNYIIISDKIESIEYAYPVYAKIDPKILISQNLQKTSLNNLFFKKFDNIYIGTIPQIFTDQLDGSVLYIGSALNDGFLQGEEVNSIDQSPALKLQHFTK